MWDGTKITKKVIDKKSTYSSYQIEVPQKGVNMLIHAQDGSAVATLIQLFQDATAERMEAANAVRPEQESEAPAQDTQS